MARTTTRHTISFTPAAELALVEMMRKERRTRSAMLQKLILDAAEKVNLETESN